MYPETGTTKADVIRLLRRRRRCDDPARPRSHRHPQALGARRRHPRRTRARCSSRRTSTPHPPPTGCTASRSTHKTEHERPTRSSTTGRPWSGWRRSPRSRSTCRSGGSDADGSADEPRPAGARPRPRARASTLADCAEVARLARAILTDMGLDPLPVTSGSKGIHLYAALDGKQTSDAGLGRRARTGARARGRPSRPRGERHEEGAPGGQGARRLEPEQRREDDRRAVLAARAVRSRRSRLPAPGGSSRRKTSRTSTTRRCWRG